MGEFQTSLLISTSLFYYGHHERHRNICSFHLTHSPTEASYWSQMHSGKTHPQAFKLILPPKAASTLRPSANHLASSKAIPALAVGKLINQGGLSHKTKAVYYIPISILDSTGPEHLMEQVIVERLLSHISGLSPHVFAGCARGTPPDLRRSLCRKFPSKHSLCEIL